MKRIIGITGGVCSGKSTCTKYLSELGFKVVDCDKLGHKTYEIGTECYKKLISAFGNKILSPDKNINRRVYIIFMILKKKELGKIVFSSQNEMKKLTGIVWPEIGKLIQEEIKNCKKEILIFEAAVLLESGWNEYMNEIWILDCPPNILISRLMKRNKKTKEEAEKILNSQMKNSERRKFANVVINSEKSIEEMKLQVKNEIMKKK